MRSGNCIDLKKLRENFKNQFIIMNYHLKADLTQYQEGTSQPIRPKKCIPKWLFVYYSAIDCCEVTCIVFSIRKSWIIYTIFFFLQGYT